MTQEQEKSRGAWIQARKRFKDLNHPEILMAELLDASKKEIIMWSRYQATCGGVVSSNPAYR